MGDYRCVIRPIRRCLIALTLMTAFLSACSETPPRPAAKFAGRLLLLSGTGANGADLIELAPSPDGKSYNLSTLTSGVIDATASADQTELLYTTKSEIGIRDLHSGANKSIVKGEGYYLPGPPDP